jgi:hypothetical protein
MRAFLTGGLWAILIGGGALVVASVSTDQQVAGQQPLPPQTDVAALAAPAPAIPEVTLPAPLTEVVAVAPRIAEPDALPPAPVAEDAAAAPLAEQVVAPAPVAEEETVELVLSAPQAPVVIAPDPAPMAAPPEPARAEPPTAVILQDTLPAPAILIDRPTAIAPDAPVSPPLAVVAPAIPAQDEEVLIQTRPAEPAPVPAAPPPLSGLAEVQDDTAAPPSAPAMDLPQILPDETLPAPAPENMPAPADEVTTTLPQSAPSIRVNRPGAAPATEEPTDMPATADMSPLARYAADFDYAADLPMIAVVLLDNTMIVDAPAVLSGLPFVPTVVLNASSPDVTARMRAYRDAGIEVLLQADLPAGAQPSDVETTYIAAFDLVPEAIAVFSDGTGPEAVDRAVADQTLQLIAGEGRGFVTVPRGLGGALRNAATDGVPVANIARELDGAGESRDAIERSLQQAALRARQSGNVVLLGRTTPDTLAAIRNWAESSDPSQIALAPVSAILLEQMAE